MIESNDSAPASIVIVKNWLEELKRLVPVRQARDRRLTTAKRPRLNEDHREPEADCALCGDRARKWKSR
jgi:hypothetical protein